MLQEERSEEVGSKEETETKWPDTDEELQALIERVEKQSLREKQRKGKKKLQLREEEEPPGEIPSAPLLTIIIGWLRLGSNKGYKFWHASGIAHSTIFQSTG